MIINLSEDLRDFYARGYRFYFDVLIKNVEELHTAVVWIMDELLNKYGANLNNSFWYCNPRLDYDDTVLMVTFELSLDDLISRRDYIGYNENLH